MTGAVAGFADATGRFLPLVATLNAARVLDAAARMLGVDHAGALRPRALGARRRRRTGPGALPRGRADPQHARRHRRHPRAPARDRDPAYLARAAVEGMICGLADAVDAVRALATPVERIILVGGAARSAPYARSHPRCSGCPSRCREPGEYVARGAARQAAWVLAGSEEPPDWPLSGVVSTHADPTPRCGSATPRSAT